MIKRGQSKLYRSRIIESGICLKVNMQSLRQWLAAYFH
jgi:hypothetical protein